MAAPFAEHLYRNRIVSGGLMLLLVVVFIACGIFAALPLATMRSLILDPIGLTVPFSWVLGLGVAFVLGGLVMVASQLRRARGMIATLPHARPAEEPALVQAVAELSNIAGLTVAPPLLVLPSKEPNAFAYGMGRDSSSIAVTQGMIDLLDTDELRGVLAHELSHIASEDTRLIALVEAFNQTSGTLRRVADRGGFNIGFTDAVRHAPFFVVALGVLYLANHLALGLLQSSPQPESAPSTPPLEGVAITLLHLFLALLLMVAGVVVFFKLAKFGWRTIIYISLFVLVGFVPFIEVLANPAIGVLLGRSISRQREFTADAGAARLTGNPRALASALRKLEAHPITTLSHLAGARYALFSPIQVPVPQRWWSRPYATHPTLQARRERLEALVQPQATPRPTPPEAEIAPTGAASGGPSSTPLPTPSQAPAVTQRTHVPRNPPADIPESHPVESAGSDPTGRNGRRTVGLLLVVAVVAVVLMLTLRTHGSSHNDKGQRLLPYEERSFLANVNKAYSNDCSPRASQNRFEEFGVTCIMPLPANGMLEIRYVKFPPTAAGLERDFRRALPSGGLATGCPLLGATGWTRPDAKDRGLVACNAHTVLWCDTHARLDGLLEMTPGGIEPSTRRMIELWRTALNAPSHSRHGSPEADPHVNTC